MQIVCYVVRMCRTALRESRLFSIWWREMGFSLDELSSVNRRRLWWWWRRWPIFYIKLINRQKRTVSFNSIISSMIENGRMSVRIDGVCCCVVECQSINASQVDEWDASLKHSMTSSRRFAAITPLKRDRLTYKAHHHQINYRESYTKMFEPSAKNDFV